MKKYCNTLTRNIENKFLRSGNYNSCIDSVYSSKNISQNITCFKATYIHQYIDCIKWGKLMPYNDYLEEIKIEENIACKKIIPKWFQEPTSSIRSKIKNLENEIYSINIELENEIKLPIVSTKLNYNKNKKIKELLYLYSRDSKSLGRICNDSLNKCNVLSLKLKTSQLKTAKSDCKDRVSNKMNFTELSFCNTDSSTDFMDCVLNYKDNDFYKKFNKTGTR